ncbi:AMSH-like ubiquitin thioesterase 1 isoform X2 [Rhodamnia argentea]|uniref:AMSH-like ubiquitin thioesterase 1 isoform X2 n=1 Tax=Rhodamnia argentea TaxID=178133 RepID=A0A8B8PL75_9MYRT|nr:AMSH-like ubiquitin thioesterase 1 isoform X2 [Rhodamnia argentea]
MRSSSSSSGRIDIAASAQRLDVDNCIALRFYYRIADNVLKQANIFREENNIVDLYVMLLRFSSLVSETIPRHRDYRASSQKKKDLLKKQLLNALTELEELKPKVQQKIDGSNRKQANQMNNWGYCNQSSSLEWTPGRKQISTNYDMKVVSRPASLLSNYRSTTIQPPLQSSPVNDPFRKISLSMVRPKEETLSRHSILGPNGLNGHWQPPRSDKWVQYPSNIDLTPVEVPSRLLPSVEDKHAIKKDSTELEKETSSLDSNLVVDDANKVPQTEEEPLMISFETTETTVQAEIIRQPSPPPVLAEVQDLIPGVSHEHNDLKCGLDKPASDNYICSESPLQLHISTALMNTFMKLAKVNTDRNLETCGILAGSLKHRKFFVTALIIPKQESTSDSCQTTNEEEIFEVQDKQSLFPLGWIHTHPTQSCFMSSIDLHTHYSYQIMLPESVAIVMAPRDGSRTHGIFRLTTPGGMSVIRQCQQRGFHPHNQPSDGGPIYKSCTDVYMNPDLKFDIIDLR